jgi:ribosomal protein L11 methyltransferase
MDDFKPQQFGNRLWICPTWATPPEPYAVNLMLDPGLAFGTGTHPTTALCLTWLEANAAFLQERTVIDYGCGSGILAIAALKLGATHLYAVDIDEQALTATKNNIKTNNIDSQQITITTPEALNTATDLLLANILLAPLMTLKERFLSLLKPRGFLVVSGILEEQAPHLIQAYDATFTLSNQFNKDGWSLLVFELK